MPDSGVPATRADFWQAKFDTTVVRDARQLEALQAFGWRVLVLWECELKYETIIAQLEAAVV